MLKQIMTGTALAALSVGFAAAANAQGAVSDGRIKIGVLNDRSGIYADVAGEGSAVAARMAAEEFGNAIDGAPIEIVVADHQNKADIAANVTRQWIDREQVDVIADVPNSAAALAVQEITRDKNRIFLMSGPGSSRLTGDACSPTGIHWTYDNHALAAGTARALTEEGKNTWYFITADYAFGHSLEEETTAVVKELGGQVLGSVRHPLGNSDFSSFLLQAQGSGSQVIGLANAGNDTTNAIKQANEFGITQAGQTLAGMLLFISDVNALGLNAAQGLVATTGFYWDMDEDTRAWSAKYQEKTGSKPTMVQAGVYSSVKHYLKAVQAAKTDEAKAVVSKMHELPIQDMFAKNGKILSNGRMVHDMYLARVKAPSESKGPWDYYEIVSTIPGDQAYLDAAASGCKIAQK
ncbi:ABC transporter substrate-binding protein [Skermanella mucosa]|uniref:ABC transporter substrate-binding protein n=1 Tax=Skermanella mucosa TaxID=1789672 RepID=UPI00192A8B32|nr:ABC transporter substrate-binding protein [Skermanella mucosa]UEM24122.1 ABC transporter substrate-binding protein [Skermanella mucosa]